MPRDPLPRLRKLCLALPETREVETWGAPTFRVKTVFAMYVAAGSNHHEGRAGVWLKAAPGNQPLMVREAPDRFFVPPYVGPSGWIGVYLDSPRTDWAEVAELLRDAWRLSAPKKLVAREAAAVTPAAKATTKKKSTTTKKPAAKRKSAAKRESAATRRSPRKGA